MFLARPHSPFDIMALFSKKKNNSTQSAPKKQIIKVNPYENPENVLELMSSICSAQPTVNSQTYWEPLREAYQKEVRGKSLEEYLREKRADLLNPDMQYDLETLSRELFWDLESRENTEHTQIVVAGGFSSGKSSFLNRLTNCTNLLPTGVEPVSVVKTYLYCSKKNRSISVKGVNQKNVLVNLNTGVLQAIQHAKQSNIYLASVLEKLFVEIPSQDLDGLVFIDTPGYNNSDKSNASNGKTDRDTALEALKEGNVLFWLVDCERGTTVANDLEIIKQFEGEKIVFIFNKADKKGEAECAKIVENAALALGKEFPQERIIDIIAYSTVDNKIYYSQNKKTLRDIVDEAKKSGNGLSGLNSIKQQIGNLFDNEITASQNTIEGYESQYDKYLKDKNEWNELYQNAKEYQDSLVKELQNILVQSYDEVMSAADRIGKASLNTLDKFEDFINTMYTWDNTEHECWTNTLTPKIDQAHRAYDRCCNTHNKAIEYKYYNEEYRKEIVKRVQKEEDEIVGNMKRFYDEAAETCTQVLENIAKEKVMIEDMEAYKQTFMLALENGIKQYQQNSKATQVQHDESAAPNVFECIKKDNYKLFLHCFEEGVDLSVNNADGYNPLTQATHTGNNMMVQFLLDHDADPAIKDKRGYNAFHTAVEDQFRDICKMLLDHDPDLIETKTASGETVEALAQKQTFTKWLEREIDNAL